MSPRLPTLLTFLILTASAGAAAAADAAAPPPDALRPLNLSLPRDAVWTSTVRPEPATAERHGAGAADLPDPGARPPGGPGQRGRMPYGSGYEARQRDAAGGAHAGAGGGRGGGRGMGRGR